MVERTKYIEEKYFNNKKKLFVVTYFHNSDNLYFDVYLTFDE